MNGGKLSAVVVTFHPEADVAENLRALRSQVETVVIVDNGSSLRELEWLRDVCEADGVALIENGCNRGLAAGLNIGLRRLLEEGDEGFVLLFDQDSRVTAGFARAMLEGFRGNPWEDRLGLLAPRCFHRELGLPLAPDRLPEGGPEGGLETAMTSGSMVRLQTLREQGLFVEEMFIDGVDQEYCLRLRRAGYAIGECAEAVLLHSPGAVALHRIFGRKFQTANYSASRRFYQERNKVWLYRRYFRSFPRYCRRLLLTSLRDFGKIVFVEEGKWRKIRYFLLGVWHGVCGRMGAISIT